MDTKLLETLVAVAEAGNLSAAGSMLNITQSMVSRRIGELEMHCGVRLLYRHGRGVKLTPAGETLYQCARPLLSQIASVLHSVAEVNVAPSGTVAMAISPSLASAVGVKIIKVVASEYPGIRLQTVTGYSRYVHEWLLQGRVDIGVLSDAGLSNQLIAEDLGAANIVLIGRPEHFPVSGPDGTLDFNQLTGVPLIVPTQGQGLRRYIDLAADQVGIRLNIACEVDDIGLTKELVAAGKGFTLLSELAVLKEAQTGEFLRCIVAGPRLYAPSMLATALNRPITPAMKAVIAIVKKIAANAFNQAGKTTKRS